MRCLIVFGLFFALPGPAGLAVPAPNNAERIPKLIADLDADNFRTREAATKELLRFGVEALPALKDALAESPSEEAARRIKSILQVINPVFEGHSPGWHWVYQDLVHSQTFKSPGTTIDDLKLRVARMNEKKPAGALEVEVRDAGLAKIYFRGTIAAADSTTGFKWHTVKSTHKAALAEGEDYVLLFHSRDTRNTACWALNAIYSDLYPQGQHGVHAHEDFFFEIRFANRRTLRVGPDGENTKAKTPNNSGNGGGTELRYGTLKLGGQRELPEGKEVREGRK